MGGNTFLIMGVVVVLGVAINFVRLWGFISGSTGGRGRIARIANSDAHLWFDERIAEHMRELAEEPGAKTPDAPGKGFGRRGL